MSTVSYATTQTPSAVTFETGTKRMIISYGVLLLDCYARVNRVVVRIRHKKKDFIRLKFFSDNNGDVQRVTYNGQIRPF